MKTRTFEVTEEKLIERLLKKIGELDADSLADVAEHVMGGRIYPPSDTIYPPSNNNNYTVVTNETYNGALD